MNKLPSISLGFCEGSSDKIYKAAIEKVGELYSVQFAFGRRGATLQTGTKTNQPVPLAEATKIYDKLVLSKTAKGYKSTGEGGGIASSITNAVKDIDQRDTGLRPQLLNPITEDEAEKYILDDDFCAQEKFDGKRMQIKKVGSEIVAANRKGLSIGFPDAIASSLATLALNAYFVADGEAVGDVFNVFDLLECHNTNLRDEPYSDRLDQLKTFIGGGSKAVVVAETAIGTTAKRKMMARLKAEGKEGIVFKKLSAKWYAGRPASGGSAVKCKFWHSVSCVVTKINAKRSIQVSIEGQSVGNVTIPPNWEIPRVGQIVEIKYLYCVGKGGSLYQPIYLGPRDDIDASECTFAQQKLKYKPENED